MLDRVVILEPLSISMWLICSFLNQSFKLEVVLGIPALSFSLLEMDICFEMLNVTFKVAIITFSKHE